MERIKILTAVRGHTALSNDKELDIIKPNTAIQQQQSMSSSMQSLWNITPGAMQEVAKSANIFRMSHGMFAGVPIICKDYKCPYLSVCTVDPQYRTLGQRCPMEAGAVMGRFEAYCNHFSIDLSNPTPEDTVDIATIRDLVDIEVQMLRAENRLAISGDFIGQTINTVDNKGKAWFEDTVTPEAQYKLTLLDKKYKLLEKLNATRKDKIAMMKSKDNPSVKAKGIFKKVKELLGDQQNLLEGFNEAQIAVEYKEGEI